MSKRRIVAGFCLAAALALGSGSAGATRPAAVVEDLTGTLAGIGFMDYLEAGRKIALGPAQKLVLSYLESCTNETIVGGTVTVGIKESAVDGGKVERKSLPCDGGTLLLSAAEAGKSGVAVFRDPPISIPGRLPRVQITLFSSRPVLSLKTPGQVTFERLDQPEEPFAVEVPAKVLDLARTKTQLVPGAIYRASAGKQNWVVRIDAGAAAGGGPVVGRLLSF